MQQMTPIPRVTAAHVLDNYIVHLHFRDGTEGNVDLAYLRDYGGVFEPLRDPTYFRRMRVSRTLGTLVWPNEADIAPETLYEVVRENYAGTVAATP